MKDFFKIWASLLVLFTGAGVALFGLALAADFAFRTGGKWGLIAFGILGFTGIVAGIAATDDGEGW